MMAAIKDSAGAGLAESESTEPTRVIFRKFRLTDEVIAFFPDIDEGNYLVRTYMHVGQHSAGMYPHDQTVPAHPDEYRALKQELERIGYQLRIVRRVVRKR